MPWLLLETPASSVISTDFRSSFTCFVLVGALLQDARGPVANLHLSPQLSKARMTQLPLVHFSPDLMIFEDSLGL